MHLTTGWIAITGATPNAPRRIVDATARWTDAASRLITVSNRLDTAFARLHTAVTGGVIRIEPVPSAFPIQAIVPRPPAAREAGEAPVVIVEPRGEATAVAGAKRISRGRAPPFLPTCTL